VGVCGGSSKNANRIFSQRWKSKWYMFNRFFTVLQNLMAFVEKLQPVEKVDFEWCRNWDPQFWQKFWRLQVYEKGHNRGSFVVGVKWKVSFDVKISSADLRLQPLLLRTPMCVTVANSPKRHLFLTNLSSLIAASPNMVLTKKQRKDGDWRTFYTSTQGWNGKYAQVRVENEDKRFAWFIHAFLGVGGWLPLVTSCVSL